MTLWYQVDYSVASSGKRIAVTKRRVRWRWGTANEDALANGATGVKCRGREHEVTLVWSITSGKRLVLMDGKEIHFSTGSRTEGKFQHSWTASKFGNDVITIIAYAAAPLQPIHGFKQFDLVVNGQSFSYMNHIYELGARENDKKIRQLAVPTNFGQQAITHPPNKEEWKWAQQVIKLEQKREMNQAGQTRPILSRSLPADVPQMQSNPVVSRSNSAIIARDILSEPSVNVHTGDLLSASLPVQVNPYMTPSDDEFDPNKPPTYEAIWSTIMDAYDSVGTNQVDAGAGETKQWKNTESARSNVNPTPIHHIQPGTHHECVSIQDQTNGIHNNNGMLHVQTENIGNNSENMQVQSNDVNHKTGVTMSPRDVSGIDGAMQNLVNLEDILAPALNTTLTMNPFDKKNKTIDQSISSHGRSPKMGSQGQIGQQFSLLELKQMQGSKNANITKDVMKIHTQYAAEQNPAAMVIYNQPHHYSHRYTYTS